MPADRQAFDALPGGRVSDSFLAAVESKCRHEPRLRELTLGQIRGVLRAAGVPEVLEREQRLTREIAALLAERDTVLRTVADSEAGRMLPGQSLGEEIRRRLNTGGQAYAELAYAQQLSMPGEFDVTIDGGRKKETYRVFESSHNDTAANAAIKALRTYSGHGLSSFPMNRGELTVTVIEVVPNA
jgi:hypothetical protein